MKEFLLRILTSPTPLRVALARKIIRRFSLFSYRDRLNRGLVDRAHYGHCIYEAAKLAARLNYPKISAIEFGCGGGNGLLCAEYHISEVQRIFPVHIELYGFDTGKGLPSPRDYRDFPHYFKPKLYSMDLDLLKAKLKIAELVIGDVKNTCRTFLDEYNPAPIGCIFHDLDYYSSTRDALTLFEADAAHFLPRIFMYFDDVQGDNTWLVSEFAGELLAIDEFNKQHQSKKIALNRCGLPQVFIYHDFDHPRYNEFVADIEQNWHEAGIKLR
jgi:hypothetical protein